jgi:hypothetical protein
VQVPNLPATDSLYKFVAIGGALGVLTCVGLQAEYIARLDSDVSKRAIEEVVLRADTEGLRDATDLQVKELEFRLAADERLIKSAEDLKGQLQDEVDHSGGPRLTAVTHRASDLMGERLARIVPQHEKTRALYAALQLQAALEGARLKTRAQELQARLERDMHLSNMARDLLWLTSLVMAISLAAAHWGFRRWYHFQKMQDALLVAQFNALRVSVSTPQRLTHEP